MYFRRTVARHKYLLQVKAGFHLQLMKCIQITLFRGLIHYQRYILCVFRSKVVPRVDTIATCATCASCKTHSSPTIDGRCTADRSRSSHNNNNTLHHHHHRHVHEFGWARGVGGACEVDGEAMYGKESNTVREKESNDAAINITLCAGTYELGCALTVSVSATTAHS